MVATSAMICKKGFAPYTGARANNKQNTEELDLASFRHPGTIHPLYPFNIHPEKCIVLAPIHVTLGQMFAKSLKDDKSYNEKIGE